MQVSVFSHKLDKINTLSQSVQLGLQSPFDLREAENVVPWQFSTMFKAKNQSKRFITIRKDEFDPKLRIQWLVTDYLAGKFAPLSFEEIAEYVRESFVALGRSSLYWERVYAFFIGVGSKEAKQINNVAKKNADHIRMEITEKCGLFEYDDKKYAKAPKMVIAQLEEMMFEWITAYACSIFTAKEFQWIVPTINIEKQLLPDSEYPRFDDFVTIIEAHELLTFVNKFTMIKRASITQFFSDPSDSRRRVSSSVLAHATSNEIAGLHQGVTPDLDARAVVEALFYIWRFALYPGMDIPSGLPKSVLEHQLVSDLSRNYSIYQIHNENVLAGKDDYSLAYEPNSITEFVFTHFSNAMASISPFETTTLDTEVESIRKVSSRDHLQRPTLIQLYENPKADGSTATFTVSRLNDFKFLNKVPMIGDLFEDANDKIASAMTFDSMMKLDRTLHEQTPISNRLSPDGVEMTINLPSLLLASIRYNLDPVLAMEYASPSATIAQRNNALLSILEKVLNDKHYSKTLEMESRSLMALFESGALKVGSGKLPKELGDYSLVHRITTRLDELRRSVYIKLMVIAIKKSDSISLVHHEGYDKMAVEGSIVGLQFALTTNLMRPLSESAIRESLIKTTEPLEALLYTRDWDETSQKSYYAPALPDQEAAERHDNQWDWHQFTRGLRFTTVFSTTMLRQQYDVDITERDLLRQRNRVRYIRRTNNAMLIATASTWIAHVENRLKSLEKQQSTADRKGEHDLALATRGVIIGILQEVVEIILELSKVTLAQQYAKKVRVAIPEQMRGRDLIDHASEVNTPAFEMELSLNATAAILSYVVDTNVWSGLLTITKRFKKYNIMESLLARAIANRNHADEKEAEG